MAYKNPTRRAVIKHKPTTIVKQHNVAQLAGQAHYHSCSNRECRSTYYCLCHEPAVNGRCRPCQGRRHWGHLDERHVPQACCYGNVEMVPPGNEWLDWARLAGPGPWFKCNTCTRMHGWPLA